MKNCAVLLVVYLCIAASPTSAANEGQQLLAFTHAVIIDGKGGAPVEGGALIVRGSRIEAVGSMEDVAIPPGAEVIDLGGRTIMPGLADMHVHLVGGWDGKSPDMLGYQRYLNALLYSGVTTVLDLGNVLPFIVQLRNEVAAGRIRGPQIYCAGPLIDGADPFWPHLSVSLTSVDQIPNVVSRLAKERVDVLKAYVGLSDRLMSALVREGRKQSLPVFVDQSWRNGSIELVMGDGVTVFAHAPDFPPTPESVAMMKPREVRFITTLTVVESQSRRRLSDLSFVDSPLILKTVPPSFISALRAEAERELGETERNSAAHNTQRLKMRETSVKRLFDAGLLLVAGTDAPYPGVFQGEGLHRELELVVEAGLRPIDAITLATANAARLMGAEREWGTLESGKRADMIVVNGRPDQRIQESRNIDMVVLRGRMLDRSALELDPEKDPGFEPVVAEPISD